MSYSQSIPAWPYQAFGLSSPVLGFGEPTPPVPRYGWRYHPAEDRIVCNVSLSGTRLMTGTNSMTNRATVLDALINEDYTPVSGRDERAYILVLMAGTNQDTGDGYEHAANVGAYCLARQARGFRVLLCTLADRTDGLMSRWDSYVSEYHTTIKAPGWAAAHGVNQIIDMASIANIGATGAANNTTYFETDKVHMKAAGHALAGALAQTHINLEIADILS